MPGDPKPMNDIESILVAIEEKGGGYVWDAEVRAVMLMNVPMNDEDALALCKLAGVQQIIVEASGLSFPMLQSLARIRGLESLVLNHSSLTPEQVEALAAVGPEIVRVDEGADQ